jgi:hypothetical protein
MDPRRSARRPASAGLDRHAPCLGDVTAAFTDIGAEQASASAARDTPRLTLHEEGMAMTVRHLLRCGAFTIALDVLGTCAFAQTSAPTTAARAEATERNLRAYAELLRADVRAGKVAIITEMMAFTEAEDAAFWPVYRDYDVELATINDERIDLIGEYARNYAAVTDELADKLALKALDLEARRTALRQKYYERFKSALSARTAARFLQVEHQLLLVIDLQIAASLPIVK